MSRGDRESRARRAVSRRHRQRHGGVIIDSVVRIHPLALLHLDRVRGVKVRVEIEALGVRGPVSMSLIAWPKASG